MTESWQWEVRSKLKFLCFLFVFLVFSNFITDFALQTPGLWTCFFLCWEINISSSFCPTYSWFIAFPPRELSYPLWLISTLGYVFFRTICLSCFGSATESCLTLSNPINCIMPGFPVLHYLLSLLKLMFFESVMLSIPSHLLLSPSPPALNLSQHLDLFQWVGSSYQITKVLELQHQCLFLRGLNKCLSFFLIVII